ncbi:MAG: GFA family protein [Luteimonas sp.]|nr:GFA family protein [Luteimonas sp.]
MSVQTYAGSCHCGNVKFEADIDLSAGTGKCNCSFCSKTRNWSATIKPEAFRLLSDADATIDYQFNTQSTHWPFCKTCGGRPYGEGDIPEAGGKFVTLSVTGLDGLTAQQLADLPVRYCNGRDNDWWHEVSDVEKRYL